MAEGKKSFLFYCDYIDLFNELPDDKAGALIKHILAYVNDQNPTSDDVLIRATFAPIKHALKRDLKKWETYINKQRTNGEKGGRPKNPTDNKITHGLSRKPKKPDTVTATVSVTVLPDGNEIQSLDVMKNNFENDFELHRIAFQESEFNQKQLAQAKTEFWNVKELDSETCAKPYKDVKKHFLNWCRQNKKRIKNDTKNGNDKKHGRVSENDLNDFISGKSK